MPRVSVVIPTYNRWRLTSEAVDSVLAQTYRDFELIVVDDGSTDGSASRLAERFVPRVVVLRLPANREKSAARNAGWRAAGGELIAFLDSDDLWLPDKLARQVPMFDDPDVGLVHGFASVVDQGGKPLEEATDALLASYRAATRRGYTYTGMSERCVMYSSTVVLRRRVLDQVGGYDPAISGYEDWDVYLRAARVARVRTLEAIIARYRQHVGNSPNSTMSEGRIQVCLKHLRLLDERPDWPDARRARRNFCANLAAAYYVLDQPEDARRWFLAALRTDPTVAVSSEWRRLALTLALPPAILRRARAAARKSD